MPIKFRMRVVVQNVMVLDSLFTHQPCPFLVVIIGRHADNIAREHTHSAAAFRVRWHNA
jgi:hypothetical protein